MTKWYKDLNLKQVQLLAYAKARQYSKGRVVIGLSGNLGSGKTTFVKSFAKVLGVKTKSPTFTIINASRKGKVNFYHLDLYRLKKYSELEALGFHEIIAEPGAITLIEWSDKFPKLKKHLDLNILFQFSKHPNKRHVKIIDHYK